MDPTRPHYCRFVPTVIRNHERHHSSWEDDGKDEGRRGARVEEAEAEVIKWI